MTMPNFLIIGAQKAGTTALYRYLQEHPQIYMSPVKEPGFFAFEGEKPDFSGPGNERLLVRTITDLEAYRKLFEEVTNELAIGEATTLYLQSFKALKRIKHYIPNAKLIIILRNPVDRAYSAFMHLKRENLERIEDFRQALFEEDKRIKNNWGFLWRYKNMGLYSSALQNYFNHFEPHQIRVYLYEDFNNNPREILRDIFTFLNVDDRYFPDFLSRYNVSGIPKSKILYNFMSKDNKIRDFLKPFIPRRIKSTMEHYLRIYDHYFTRYFLTKPKLDSKLRNELIEIFRDDIVNIQGLLRRDLSAWLEKEV